MKQYPSISTDRRPRHRCNPRTAAYLLPESPPARSSSAGSRGFRSTGWSLLRKHGFPVYRLELAAQALGVGLEVRFKDWFQDQFCGGLRHPVPYRRDTQWPLAPARFRNQNSPHRLWLICFVVQFFPEPVQPLLQPVRFDVRKAFPIHTWCAILGFRLRPCVLEYILAIHLS